MCVCVNPAQKNGWDGGHGGVRGVVAGELVENISFFVHGDGTARLRKMALLSSS